MTERDETAAWASPAPVSAAPAPPSSTPTPATHPGAPGWHAGPASSLPAQHAAPTYASWQPGFMPLRPLGFGDLLSLPFRAMRFNRAVIIGGPLLLTLGATLLTSAAMWLLFTDPSLALLDPYSEFNAISPSTVAVIVVAIVAALLADVLSSAIVAPGVARGALGERITLGQAWATMRTRIGALLLLYVIATGTLLAVLTVGAIPLIAGAFAESPGLIVLGVVLVVLLSIPAGVLVTMVGGLARPIVVLERRGAIAAIRRAIGLLRGRFWWSLLIIFVATALIGLVSSVLQQVGGFGAVAVSLVAPDNLVLLGIAFFIVTALSLVVSYVLTYSYLGSLFALLLVDLRIRHEGFDLTLAQAAEARRRT